MREIKFRVWNISDEEMDYDIAVSGPVIAYNNSQECEGWDLKFDAQFIAEDEQLIMQYSGLKDKNGKEIYEGDIVTNELYNYQVKFGLHSDIYKSSNYGWYLQTIGENNSQHGICDCLKIDLSKPIEYLDVIGNIYENPELLGEG